MADFNEKLDYSPATGEFRWKQSGKRAGCRREDGYVMIRYEGVLRYAHRMAWSMIYGVDPSEHIDHINGVKGDNRISNLRDVSNQINAQNCRSAIRPSNKSGYRGVWVNGDKWQAVITLDGKRHCLGTYKTPEDAHHVYLAAKRRLHEGCTI